MIEILLTGNAAWAHILAKNQLRDNPKELNGDSIFITDDTTIDSPYDFLKPFIESKSMTLSTSLYPAALAVIFVYIFYIFSRIVKPLTVIDNPFPHPGTVYYTGIFIVTYFFAGRFINAWLQFLTVNIYTFNRLKSILRLNYKPIYDYEQSVANSLSYYKTVPLL